MLNLSGTEQQTHLADSVGAHVRAQAAAETFEVPIRREFGDDDMCDRVDQLPLFPYKRG